MRISDWSSDVCSSDLDGNCATSALIGRELSFAVREIVANAVRHAGATMVNFALEPDGNRIALQVSDDGVPNMARLGSSGAVPSRSLMRRIQMLGGEVFLQNIGGRTTLRITVPRQRGAAGFYPFRWAPHYLSRPARKRCAEGERG